MAKGNVKNQPKTITPRRIKGARDKVRQLGTLSRSSQAKVYN